MVKNIKISLTTQKYSRAIEVFIHLCIRYNYGVSGTLFKLLIWQMCYGAM